MGYLTGTVKVTLWEEHVDTLQNETCYRLKNFVVREYALSMPKAGAVITPIDNIGGVVQPMSENVSSTDIFNVEIIGVPQIATKLA